MGWGSTHHIYEATGVPENELPYKQSSTNDRWRVVDK